MGLLNDLKNILNSCNCKREKYLLDEKRQMLVAKGIDAANICKNDCCLITKITIYLISNNIDYEFLHDYSIKLRINK